MLTLDGLWCGRVNPGAPGQAQKIENALGSIVGYDDLIPKFGTVRCFHFKYAEYIVSVLVIFVVENLAQNFLAPLPMVKEGVLKTSGKPLAGVRIQPVVHNFSADPSYD